MYVSSVLDLRLEVVAILWPWWVKRRYGHLCHPDIRDTLPLSSSDGIRVTRYLGHYLNPNSAVRYYKG